MYYIEDIDNTKLVTFFKYLFSKSKKVSFKRSYQRGVIKNLDCNEKNYYDIGFITRNEFDKIQDTMKKELLDQCICRYKDGIYISEEEFRMGCEEELETMGWYIDYDKEIGNKENLSFKIDSDEFLGNEITRCSYDTIGSFQEICYFTVDNIVNTIINQMSDLYDLEKLRVCNHQFYSFACWRNDEDVIFYTMPSDKTAVLNLSNNEYNELFKLNLGIKLSK